MSKKRIHVVTNTHWDREHREGFQGVRYALVEMVDTLIGIMENDPEFKRFLFDGQSIVLDDYLEIKPHMKDRLKALIESGRILVGPWYSLPDHFALNPESLIRNLLTGDRVCREFGNKMMLGYSIFSFGQMAQLPQIYAGFGIDTLVFYKRFPEEIITKSEFIWEAPDGTQILASRLGTGQRMDFYVFFTIPVILGGNMADVNWGVDFTDDTKLMHLTDPMFRAHHATELQQDIRIRKDKIKAGIEDSLTSVKDLTAAESVFMVFDGIDVSAPVKETPEAIRQANEIMGDEFEIIHSDPLAFFSELREEIDLDSLLKYQGEMRGGPMNRLQSELMSTNIELKQNNYRAEITVLQYAEAFAAFDKMNGGIYPADMLKKAWKYLFQVHPHDSIHASGMPKMKSDNIYRLAQAQEIGDAVARRAFEGIVSKIDTSGFDEDEILLTVFNATPCERSEVLNLEIDLPRAECVTDYHVEDLNGERLQLYEYDNAAVNMASVNIENRPKGVRSDRSYADLFVKDVPPLGYKTYKIKRTKGVFPKHGKRIAFGNPVSPYKPIGVLPNVLDNGLLRVTINQNGTVDVTDSDTGFTTKGLNVFTDTGCSGDMWIHREPAYNEVVSSFGGHAAISLTRNSGLSGTFRVDIVLEIPEGLTQDEKSRSPHTITTRISTEITLAKGSKRVDFKVRLENRSKDHKLTVTFPTGLKTDHTHSEAPFQIRRQPIENMSNVNGKLGDEPQRHPMHGFLDISDGKHGVALFTKGLKEFETRYYGDECVECHLTLLRAMLGIFAVHDDVFVFPEDQSTQCIGEHAFEYSLLFHSKNWRDGDVIA